MINNIDELKQAEQQFSHMTYDQRNRSDIMLFDKQYKKWQDQAWQEFKEGEFYEGQKRSQIGICEDGTVYNGGWSYIKNCVTSWEDSIYYVHWSA